jgi:hypothetical protein
LALGEGFAEERPVPPVRRRGGEMADCVQQARPASCQHGGALLAQLAGLRLPEVRHKAHHSGDP